jgi:diguanylate cyclase (GGDEF)-like protein
MASLDSPLTALLAALLLQMSFLALMWLGGAWLRLARRPALHWGAATLLLGCGMALIGVRDQLDPWLGRWAANVLNLAGFVLAARGVALFTRASPRDAEHGAVLLLAMAGTAAAVAVQADPRWITMLASSAMAWVLLRAAWLGGHGLRGEFGPVAAGLCALPLAGIGLITALRAAGAGMGSALGAPLDPHATAGGTQVGLMLGFIAMTLLVNGGFCGMVLLRLVGRLRHLSQHDPLTGLLNRRACEERLAAERARRARSGRPLALLSLDIDHFKRVNDEHGHAAGDAALVAVAALLRREARETDAVARLGGEEFALLLPDTDAQGAWRLAERLLEALRDEQVPHEGRTLRVTASIGVALMAANEQPGGLLRRLDRALYAAKQGGRDRAVMAEADSEAGD